MSHPPAPTLVEAYEWIKAGELARAGQMLKSYLAENPRDANAWWLMAHAVTQPETRQKCLEKVLALDPQHAKARDKLARLQAESAPREAAVPAFIMPPDLAEPPAAEADPPDDNPFAAPAPALAPAAPVRAGQPSWGPGLGGFIKPAAPPVEAFDTKAPTDPFRAYTPEQANASAGAVRAARKKDDTELVLGLAVLAIAVVVAIGVLLWVADRRGLIDLDGVPRMSRLNGTAYSVDYPQGWATECAAGRSGTAVCVIGSEKRLNSLYLYTGDAINLDLAGQESTVTRYAGDYHGEPLVSGVVMETGAVPMMNSIYQIQTEENSLYELVHSGLDDAFGSELSLDYDHNRKTVAGHEGDYYHLKIEIDSESLGEVIGVGKFKGCLASYSAYIPHDNRLLWAQFDVFMPGHCKKLPSKAIQHIIESIKLKPV